MPGNLSDKQNPPTPLQQGIWRWAQGAILIFPLLPTWGGLGLLAAIAILGKRSWQQIIQHPLNWGFAVLSVWLLVVASFAFQRTEAFLGLANFLPFFAFFATFSVLIRTPAQLRRIAWLYVFAAMPVVFMGLGQILGGWTTPEQLQPLLGWFLEPNGNPEGRLASVFMYANICAAYLCIALVLELGLWIATYRAWRRSKNRKHGGRLILLGSAIALTLWALILTSSRNAWAIAFLASLTFALYLNWFWLVAAIAGVASSILGAAFAPSPLRQGLRTVVPYYFWGRLTDRMHPDRPLALMRVTQWQFSWQLIQERPWTGWGLRNFTLLYETQMDLWLGHPHNLLLMLMVETGIPAALCLLVLVGWAIAPAVLLLLSAPDSLKDQDRLMLFTFLVAFASLALFNGLDVTVFDFRVNTLGWLLLSAIYGVTQQYRAFSVGAVIRGYKNEPPHNAASNNN